MRKSRPHKRKPEPELPRFRMNAEILAPKLRVIDEAGSMVGILTRQQALTLALEKETDLVEVFPKAEPPVAKLLNYGKFQYQQEKLARKQKAHQKKVDIKGVRISLRISGHDLDVRKNQAIKFLGEGDKVKIEMSLKGRERQYLNNARIIMDEFVAALGQNAKVESPFSKEGGRLSILVAPKS